MKKKRILIVEDTEDWQIFSLDTLKKISDDFEIDIKNSAKDGFDIILDNIKTPYDLIISDLQMEKDYYPKHAGEWLIDEINNISEYGKSRILLFSASLSGEYLAQRLGCDFIWKISAHNNPSSYYNYLKNLLI